MLVHAFSLSLSLSVSSIPNFQFSMQSKPHLIERGVQTKGHVKTNGVKQSGNWGLQGEAI